MSTPDQELVTKADLKRLYDLLKRVLKATEGVQQQIDELKRRVADVECRPVQPTHPPVWPDVTPKKPRWIADWNEPLETGGFPVE